MALCLLKYSLQDPLLSGSHTYQCIRLSG